MISITAGTKRFNTFGQIRMKKSAAPQQKRSLILSVAVNFILFFTDVKKNYLAVPYKNIQIFQISLSK